VSGAGPFSAPFEFVGMVPFQVLPQEEGAAGKRLEKTCIQDFIECVRTGWKVWFLRHRCLLGAAFVRYAG
jgi:hypothetical protein